MDDCLNILNKTELNYNIRLAGVNRSTTSCFNKGKLIEFDWSLNKLDTEPNRIEFNRISSIEPN